MSTSNTKTETYTTVKANIQSGSKATTESIVVPRTVTQSEYIARYFTEDLTYFINETGRNLLAELQIPPEVTRSNAEAINMLFDDLSHMVRDHLITGIHLLLADPQFDPNLQAYPLRYYARYTIEMPQELAPSEGQKSNTNQNLQFIRLNGHLAPPKQSWLNARFALLIDWDRSATERRRQAHRPVYCFDWISGQDRYDLTTLVRYREGALTSEDRVIVNRIEEKSPGY
jgi:hypothetical protein